MQGKTPRLWAAAFAFTLSAFFVAQSLASDATPLIDSVIPPDVSYASPSTSPSPSPSAADTPTPSPSAAPSSEASTPDLSPGPTPSPSPSKTPAYALEDQNISIRVTDSVHVDPRAKSAFITPIQLNSDSSLLACISSPSLRFDAGVPNAVDANDLELLVGDFTNSVRITGSSASVVQKINALNGLKIFSSSGNFANKYLQFRFVAISEPSTDENLCNQGIPSNNRIINITTFDIGLDMKKGDVRLAK
jgi:hypothetical protein